MISLTFAMILFSGLSFAEGQGDCRLPEGTTVDDRGIKDYWRVMRKWKAISSFSKSSGSFLLNNIPEIRPGAAGVVSTVIKMAMEEELQDPLPDGRCALVNVTTVVGRWWTQAIVANLTVQLQVLWNLNVFLDRDLPQIGYTLESHMKVLTSLPGRVIDRYANYVMAPFKKLWDDTIEMVLIRLPKNATDFENYAERCQNYAEGILVLTERAKRLLSGQRLRDFAVTDSILNGCASNSTCINSFFERAAFDLSRLQFVIPICGAFINDPAWNMDVATWAEQNIRLTVRSLLERGPPQDELN